MILYLQKHAISIFLLFLVGCASATKSTNTTVEGETIFFDGFDSVALDRNKWNVRVTGRTVNNEQQAYVDSALTIYIATGSQAEGASGGALVLHPRYSQGFTTPEGRNFDFISGRIDSRGKFEFTHGTAAARIRMTEGAGLWPAWWMLGSGRWPETGEIDIMEYVGEPDWTGVALHGPGYSGETPLVNKAYFHDMPDVTSWHVYSVDWTPQEFLFRIDGRLVYRATRAMVEHYGKWAFDEPKFLILNFALGGAYPFKTNGVKEPYNGIPQSTVDKIRAGESKMLIDWVRITKNNK